MRALAALFVVVVPRVALACPACARDRNSTASVLMIGAMLLVPLVLSGVVFAVARKAQREAP
ncbi:MAG: hypothetical protein JST54_14745 [Deltaproteobacteria bacterium]|nr:hypothetical protein [Deltaproteobacteria bacterium]